MIGLTLIYILTHTILLQHSFCDNWNLIEKKIKFTIWSLVHCVNFPDGVHNTIQLKQNPYMLIKVRWKDCFKTKHINIISHSVIRVLGKILLVMCLYHNDN